MAEADENTCSPVSDVAIAAEGAEKTSSTVVKGTDDEYPLQKVVEMEYHPDCSVCLQPCYYPVKLPCAHIFCFLCIKGVALRSKRCALCRQTITADFFEKPTLVKVVGTAKETAAKCNTTEPEQGQGTQTADETEDIDSCEYVWFYEGRNGWWQYDEKTSVEVEKAFKTGKRSCTLLIAGFLYVVDFENMFQTRKNEPGRRRRIKRDKPDAESKGIAGIRAVCKHPANAKAETTVASSSKNDDEQQQGRAGDLTPARGESTARGAASTQQSVQTEGEDSSVNVEQVASRSTSDDSTAKEGK